MVPKLKNRSNIFTCFGMQKSGKNASFLGILLAHPAPDMMNFYVFASWLNIAILDVLHHLKII